MRVLCEKALEIDVAFWRETTSATCEVNLPSVIKSLTGPSASYTITTGNNFTLGGTGCNGVGCPNPNTGGAWQADCTLAPATVAGTMRGTLAWNVHPRQKQKWTWNGFACLNGGMISGYSYCTLSATLNGAAFGTVTGGLMIPGDNAGSLNLDVPVVVGDVVAFTLFVGISSGPQTHTISGTVTIL